MRGWMFGLIALAVGIFVLGVVAIVAFVGSSDGTPIVQLDIGDCFDLPESATADGTIDSVDTIDCGTPHLAEVVLVGSLNEGDEPYPPDDELFASVDRACREADVVESAAFGLLPIAPTLELWESFEGRYLCVAIPFGGEPVTGSARSD
jgi:hypothetical protein